MVEHAISLEAALVHAAGHGRGVAHGHGAHDGALVAWILQSYAPWAAVRLLPVRHHVAAQVHHERVQPVLGQQRGKPVGDPSLRDAAHIHGRLRVGQLRPGPAGLSGLAYAQRAPIHVRQRALHVGALGHRALVEVPQPHRRAHGDVEQALAVGAVPDGRAQQLGRVVVDGHALACSRVQPRDVGVRQRARKPPLERATRAAGRVERGGAPRDIGVGLQGDDRVERVELVRHHARVVGPVRFVHVFQRDGVVCVAIFHAAQYITRFVSWHNLRKHPVRVLLRHPFAPHHEPIAIDRRAFPP